MAKKIYEGGILICMAIILCSYILFHVTGQKNEQIIEAEVYSTNPAKVVFKSTDELQAEVKQICLRDNPQLFKNVK